MTEAVVDGLEVVDVDEDDRHPLVVAVQRLADALGEQEPVGQVGERIV